MKRHTTAADRRRAKLNRERPAHPRQASAVRQPNVHDHDYNPETEHLTVTFHGGRQYRYEGIPRALASEFAKAPSKGSFLHQHVIGKFDHVKL